MSIASPVDLFDDANQWRVRPRDAFRAFVASPAFVKAGRRYRPTGANDTQQPIRSSSTTVYLSMFERFISWLELQGVALLDVTPAHLQTFLDLREEDGQLRLASKIRMAYIRLLERVFHHLRITPNPASKVVLDPGKPFRRGSDDEKAVLKAADVERLMHHLPAAPDWNPHSSLKRQHGWDQRRNQALVAVLLGAGLKVSEVATLRLPGLQDKDLDGNLPIALNHWDGTGSGRAHQPVVLAFAVPVLERWLNERRRMQISSELVFPAALDTGAALSLPTIYRLVNKTMAHAGIAAHHMGGRTLRNTYAAQQLASAVDIDVVGERLGHRDRRATEMYQQAAKAFGEEDA